MMKARSICALTIYSVLASAFSAPALADVKRGVDAWSAGNYDRAVAEWQGDAKAGDADAQFNLAQAYRLGRGVPQDNDKAMALYKSAGEHGHLQAADNYGLMLFQSGRRADALPFVQAASDRGDPRAQYLLGIAHFNGQLVAKDWQLAYALLTMANASGLPQAVPALAQMDEYVPLADRQAGAGLAAKMQKEADARRATQLAAADLHGGAGATATSVTQASPRIPQRVQTTALPPSVAAGVTAPGVAAGVAAIQAASRAKGTENPALGGADYARPQYKAASPASMPVARPAANVDRPAPVAAAPTVSDWQVQLGAFSVAGNADRLWSELSGTAALSDKQKVLRPAGRLTKLLVSGFASKAEADSACAALKRSGQSCLVTR